jgi:hypothetical protein
MIVVSCDVKRRDAVLAFRVDNGRSRVLLQQQVAHLQVAVLRSQVQRGEPLLRHRDQRSVVVDQHRSDLKQIQMIVSFLHFFAFLS